MKKLLCILAFTLVSCSTTKEDASSLQEQEIKSFLPLTKTAPVKDKPEEENKEKKGYIPSKLLSDSLKEITEDVSETKEFSISLSENDKACANILNGGDILTYSCLYEENNILCEIIPDDCQGNLFDQVPII